MAVAVVSNQMISDVPVLRAHVEINTLTADDTETIPFPSNSPGAELKKVVIAQIKTDPTDGSPVTLSQWTDDSANDQFTAIFATEVGGDLTGAVLVLELEWADSTAQDGTSLGL
jgi:hypothetical protein